jgi:hypothetical protein
MAKTKMEDMSMDVEEMGAAEQMATKGGRRGRAPGGNTPRPPARPPTLAATNKPNLEIDVAKPSTPDQLLLKG